MLTRIAMYEGNSDMIIDFHTHTFPEQIAKRAIAKLSGSAHIKSYSDGTLEDLKRSMKAAGIDYAVLLPVVTKPAQEKDINLLAVETNDCFRDTGILSFGGIHPDNENYREIIKNLAAHGIPGIKLHPVFQQTNFDDIRYLRIMECACENDMIILIHAGYDASFPGADFATPCRIRSVYDQLHPNKLVLAHMGGWCCWSEAEEMLAGCDVYLDTAFTLSPLRSNAEDDTAGEHHAPLSREQFLRMVRNFRTDHILFGTDSPWSDMVESIELIRESGLKPAEQEAVLGGNAAKLLNLSSMF